MGEEYRLHEDLAPLGIIASYITFTVKEDDQLQK